MADCMPHETYQFIDPLLRAISAVMAVCRGRAISAVMTEWRGRAISPRARCDGGGDRSVH